MNLLRTIYNIKEDHRRVEMIQKASVDKLSRSGYKTENGLLFGTAEWFDAIEKGVIPRYSINGIISGLYMSGHDDYPEFEIENSEGKTNWTRFGNSNAYQIGKIVELIYVEQKYKNPIDITGAISKCVVEIKISE